MIGQSLDRQPVRIFGSGVGPEVLRQRVVRLCAVIYWLLIFEGVLRKWVAPQFSNILFFVRDPFLFWVYWLTLQGPVPRGGRALGIGLLVAVAFLYFAGAQIIFGGANLSVAAYGWHNYFLYFPLAWVIYTYFERPDLDRLMRNTLIVSVPVAGLVALQFYSPADSWINKGTDATGSKVFEVVAGIVRPYGTFTFVTGQSLFVGSLVALLLTNLLSESAARFIQGLPMLCAAAACAVMLMLGGSRTAFAISGLLMGFALLSVLLAGEGRVRLRALLIPIALVAVFAASFPVIFPKAFDAIRERQEVAVTAEGPTQDRALHSVTETLDFIDGSPLLGYGIGVGTAGGAALATGMRMFTLSENELPRIIQEVGPIFGAIYVALRFVLAAYLLWLGVRSARVFNDPGVLCIGAFTIILLISGQVTYEGTVNGFTWIFAGLCLARSKPVARCTRGKTEWPAP